MARGEDPKSNKNPCDPAFVNAMPYSLPQPALQQQTLRLYGELVARAPVWAGRLVLGTGEGCSASGFPAACSLAGAACLLLEPSVAQAKAALRDGGLDFLVSTADEALRTLKNEVRRGRPLAVALTGETSAASEELVDRGVLPELVFREAGQGPFDRSSESFAGAVPVHSSVTETLRLYLGERRWAPYTWTVAGRAAMQTLDADLLETLREDDSVRRRWIEGIARNQRSAERDYRTAWLTPEERERIPTRAERAAFITAERS